MRHTLWRSAFGVGLGIGILSCTESPTGPAPQSVDLSVRSEVVASSPQLVISQVYGGGGNSGAVYKSDFIEIFNPGQTAVTVTGWSVQYASAAGTTWQATPLSGSIPAGGYYLVKEANGSGGTTDLPGPDATGTIAMSGTSAKVALVSSTVALSGTCPSGVIDEVSYGSVSPACGTATAALTNTTSASRNSAGCAYSGSTSADFTVGTVAPRFSGTTPNVCPTVSEPATSATVAPDSANITVGSTQSFTATARDASNNVVSTTFTWSSTNESVATVNASGVATAVAPGVTTITATTANNVAGTAKLVVVAAPAVSDVVISQIYGGGGNSGAKYTHDYVELFNRSSDSADVTGWTIQYSSAGGSSWAAFTIPAAKIGPRKYYLVQLASQAAVGVALPAPDASATAPNMSGTSGKVILTLPGIAPSGIACPTGAGIVDRVGYGTSTNCSVDWNGSTSNLNATTAAFRKNDGCVKTGSITNDFIVLEANPHNGSSPAKNCDAVVRPISSATIVINELMGDPANAESASWGEWFEVHNYGAQPVNLRNWTILSGGTSQPDHVISADVIVPAGGYAVLGRGADVARNGGVNLDYNYFVGTAGTIWLDDIDYLMLVDADGARSDSVAWTSMARGVTEALRDASLPHADVNGSNWGYSTVQFGDGDYGTPGAANGTLADIAPVVSANKITISGRVATDAPLPVGFEAQLFASEANSSGVNIPTTFTWESLTPDIASIDSRGVMHANTEGTARFKVVAADGTSRIHTLSMIIATASTTAEYLDNAAFGEPVDADASDDFIIRRPQYTTSFNHNLGTPNWVAYDLNVTDIAPGQDRCNCFTFDPELIAAGFWPYNTADYTGAGAFLGTGIGVDRGHMVRSFDRTAGTLDNARTYYFSNVVPQFSDLNQGPWANMENELGAMAQSQNKEVYIHVGPAGSIGTVKNEGKINFPKYTWKIALILPRGEGVASVTDYRDVQVIAVVMPNETGVRNVDWHTYEVTVDSVEALTGYDFLTALSAKTQRALEANIKPPLGTVDGPYTGVEAGSISLSGAGSIDPNGTIVSYLWNFGDGATGSGSSVSHTYANNGTYTVTLIVTDNDALADTVTTSANVANVTPTVQSFSGATLLRGESYAAAGTFTDPGADTWTGSVNYGDGSGSQSLALSGNSFSLSHTYSVAGTFTVTVGVFDGDATGNNSATVTVLSSLQGVGVLGDMVAALVSNGTLSANDAKGLTDKLDAAAGQIAQGKSSPATKQLQSFINHVDTLRITGRLTAAQAADLKAYATRLIASL